MTALRYQSIPHRPSPAYPTKLDALATPSLLKNHVPPVWLGCREIAGALGAFLAAGAAGCRSETSSPGVVRGTLDPKTAAIVAPLFEHGKGQGESRWALGCSAVAAPTYLPEEEALALICDELRKYGLEMSQRSVELAGITIAGHELRTGYEWISNMKGTEYVEVSGPLVVDLVDPERRVTIEYVAQTDFDTLGGDDRGCGNMDIKGVAVSVGREVEKQGLGIYFATFYDPVRYFGFWMTETNDKYDWAGSEHEAQDQARRMLREQVHDFVAWLKGQGVI